MPAQTLEHVASEQGFFSPTRDKNRGPQSNGERRTISSKEVKGLVDGRSTYYRHHDGLHQEFEDAAKTNFDGQADCARKLIKNGRTALQLNSPHTGFLANLARSVF
jgi:hypothetical protein